MILEILFLYSKNSSYWYQTTKTSLTFLNICQTKIGINKLKVLFHFWYNAFSNVCVSVELTKMHVFW